MSSSKYSQILVPVIIFFLLVLTGNSLAANVDFLDKPMVAGRSMIHGEGYVESRVMGVTSTSRDLRLPIQLMYNSTNTRTGIFGYGWRCPQLESSSVPLRGGVEWTTPWGEKIQFSEKSQIKGEESELYKDEIKGRGRYFAPYSDWEADPRAARQHRGQSGSWTFSGKGEYKGWSFAYIDSKLQSVVAPSGYRLDYIYKNGKLLSVCQNGVEFVTLTYDDGGFVSGMTINGVSYEIKCSSQTVTVLPNVLNADSVESERTYLLSWQRGSLNPVQYSYNEQGYLVSVRQGDWKDNLSVSMETPEQRHQNLQARAGVMVERNGKKEKIRGNGVTSGRLQKDRALSYSYSGGGVSLKNKKGQAASFSLNTGTGVYHSSDFSGREKTAYYYRRHDVAYMGKIRQIVDGRGRTAASWRYDKATGNPVRVTDMGGNDVDYDYDDNGHLREISLRGAEQTKSDPLIRLESDGRGNPVKVSKLSEFGGEMGKTIITYDGKSNPVKVNDGRITRETAYNAHGYPVRRSLGKGTRSSFVYDRYNNLKSVESSNGVVTTFSYDDNGQQTEMETKDGEKVLTSSKMVYDGNGLLVSCEGGLNGAAKVDRDEDGRVVREYDANGAFCSYEYDPVGKLSRVVDRNGNPLMFEWGKNGLMNRTTAEKQIQTCRYDDHGRLVEEVSTLQGKKESDRKKTYEYDDLDRLVEVDYGNGEKQTWGYDSWGRRVGGERSDGRSASFEYDRFGQLIQMKDGDVTTVYEYNEWGQRTGRTTTGNGVVSKESREYDDQGNLSKLASGDTTIFYAYDKDGRKTRETVNGVPTDYTYDRLGRLVSKTMRTPVGDVAASLKYTYDDKGRVASRDLNGKKSFYAYDGKGQLLAVTGNGKTVESYVYDPEGNILAKKQNDKETTFTYDKANQLVSKLEMTNRVDYNYDAAGRMVREGERNYHYGWLDKVMKITEGKNDEQIASYAYGIYGQLESSEFKGKEEAYLWDGLALVNRSGEEIVNDPAETGGNPVTTGGKILFNDMLGTTLGCFSNNQFQENGLTAFGAKSKPNSPEHEASFFTGKPYVEGLGYSFLYRNYRPDLGRWQIQDLIGYPDGWNNHIYAFSPTSGVDPNGLGWKFIGSNTVKGESSSDFYYLDTIPGIGTIEGGYNIVGFDAKGEATSVTLDIGVSTSDGSHSVSAWARVTFTIDEDSGSVSMKGSATGLSSDKYVGSSIVINTTTVADDLVQLTMNLGHAFVKRGGGWELGVSVIGSGGQIGYSWSGSEVSQIKCFFDSLKKKKVE